MLCVPEGGMNYDWDLTYIIDGQPFLVQSWRRLLYTFFLGMTTVEHAIPVPILYNDVQILFALSGTGSTPTHVVNYGGAFGEQFVWAHQDVPNDPKYNLTVQPCIQILNRLTDSGDLRDMTSWKDFLNQLLVLCHVKSPSVWLLICLHFMFSLRFVQYF